MTKANITQYDSTPSNNADINDINIAENCPASNINNAIRELMAHLKNVDTGSQALTALSVTGALSCGAFTSNGIDDNADATAITIDSSERVNIGTGTPPTADSVLTVQKSGAANEFNVISSPSHASVINLGDTDDYNICRIKADNSDNSLQFQTNNSERMRILSDGNISIAKTTANNTTEGTSFFGTDGMSIVRSAGTCQVINRLTNDGVLVSFRQASGDEGNISVSGSTISYNGFSGLHESSGIATDTPIGTVVSTIDELDVYFAKQGEGDSEEDNPKSGQTRADHAKVKVSDTEGDKAVYGVVGSFNTQGKVNVASVGIGSVRVTGACEKGDLLESNGDGTAKVQSDDIVRSKTIGKVTIGNSSTDVKLVSCVLYCG